VISDWCLVESGDALERCLACEADSVRNREAQSLAATKALRGCNTLRVERTKRLEGAALQDGSFMSCSQAAPGNVSRCGSSTGRCICRTEQTRWAKRCAGSFPGAACYQPIELPCFKAAPLQAFGAAQPAACLGPFCVPSSSGTTADRSGQVSLFCVLCVFSRLFLVLLCSLFDELD
jgi:hypothetical protein